MLAKYPATYTDANGTVETTITNDGETMAMELYGVKFRGRLDMWRGIEGPDSALLSSFPIHQGFLHSYHLDVDLTIMVCDGEKEDAAMLSCSIGEDSPNDLHWHPGLGPKLTLRVAGREYCSTPTETEGGDFECGLLEIQEQLPSPMYLKACINCQFSDYSIYGKGLFGAMLCFRNIKEEYVGLPMDGRKFLYHELEERAERSVQETFVCEDFQRRIPGTGYRG